MTIEQWARDYVVSCDLAYKCRPPKPPAEFSADETDPEAPTKPGRPACLRSQRGRSRSLSQASMLEPKNRAKLVHKFWHHELQAAELMCWAILRFADTPPEFRRGLLGICQDELRHMAMYQHYIESLGFQIGDFSVRDWFWERVPCCETPVAFVALVSMGLEAANLEHTERFANWFRSAGDERGAALQERVGGEEIAHVRFGMTWFRRWTGSDRFEDWAECLPKPLSPLLMRGKHINRQARVDAGMSEQFVAQLGQWRPEPHGRR